MIPLELWCLIGISIVLMYKEDISWTTFWVLIPIIVILGFTGLGKL